MNQFNTNIIQMNNNNINMNNLSPNKTRNNMNKFQNINNFQNMNNYRHMMNMNNQNMINMNMNNQNMINMNMNNQNMINMNMNNMNNQNMINMNMNNKNMTNMNMNNMNNQNMINMNNQNMNNQNMNNQNMKNQNMKNQNMKNQNMKNQKMYNQIRNYQNINDQNMYNQNMHNQNMNINNMDNNETKIVLNNFLNNNNQNNSINREKENEKLKQNIQNLEKDLKSKENKFNDLNDKYSQTIKIINNNEIMKKFMELEIANKKLKNEIEYLKKDKIIHILNDDNQIRNLNFDLNNQLRIERDKNIDLTNQINFITKKKDEDFENYQKNEYNPEYIGKKLEQFYDIVINIKSIRSLADKNEGWPIKWNQNYDSLNEYLKKDKKLLKIGILGNGNMGKSFLLSRIFNEKIPSGYSVITEGLSVKFNQEKNYALLDSAGLQTPLLITENMSRTNINNEKEHKEYENLYRDKTQTENFIQNLILYLSDMLLIVVGKITFNEQRLINKIKNELTNQKSKKPIFIIHNLSNFHKKEQVEEHIKDTLKKSASFYLDEVIDMEKNKRLYYVEKNNKNNEFYIYHLIMARENTDAGNYYNNYVYNFLKERFNEFPERNNLNIIDEIKNKFVEWSIDILEDKIEMDNIIIENDGKQEKKFLFNPLTNNNNDDKCKQLIPKACINDELGFAIYRSSGYDPSYTSYIEDNKFLVIKIEISGEYKIDDVYADLDMNQIYIKGNKLEDKDININNKELNNEYNQVKIIKNLRKFGKFNLIIPYGNEIKLAKDEPIKEEEIKEEGIITFKFELAKRRKKYN